MKAYARANEIAGPLRKNILHIVFQSGHAVESNELTMILNHDDVNKRFFPLERITTPITKNFKFYALLTLNDCCRSYKERSEMFPVAQPVAVIAQDET